MNAVTVSKGARRLVVMLAVAGSLLMMAGVSLGVVASVVGLTLPPGLPSASVLAGVLIGVGLLCGLLMLPASGGGGRPGKGRGRRRGADTSREWLDALRPDGPGITPGPS